MKHADDLSARRLAWIGLNFLPGWGPVRIWEAVGKDKDPLPVWRRFRSLWPDDTGQQIIRQAQMHGVQIVTYDDAAYPQNLKMMDYPPPVLFMQGEIYALDAAAVAIVGSRRASAQGIKLAYTLAEGLANNGITIVSGLAAGIDAAAHRGALAAGGRTIAVLGNGLDIIYPACNRDLAKCILAHKDNGAIVSQFPCGTPPKPGHFPLRNQIIAGLSLGTLVVEARENSGAIITARQADALSRTVMVCPGDPLRQHTLGSNRFLQEAYRPKAAGKETRVEMVLCVEDILNCLEEQLVAVTGYSRLVGAAALPGVVDSSAFETAVPDGQKKLARNIWCVLSEGPAGIDIIALRSGNNVSEVRACLGWLEVAGKVERHHGEIYSLCSLAPF